MPFSAACFTAEGAARRIALPQLAFFAASVQLFIAATAPPMFSLLARDAHASQLPPVGGFGVVVVEPVFVFGVAGVFGDVECVGEAGVVGESGGAVTDGAGGAVSSGAIVVAPVFAGGAAELGAVLSAGGGNLSSSGLMVRAATTAMAMSSTAPTAPSPITKPFPPPLRPGRVGAGGTAATPGGVPIGPGGACTCGTGGLNAGGMTSIAAVPVL